MGPDVESKSFLAMEEGHNDFEDALRGAQVPVLDAQPKPDRVEVVVHLQKIRRTTTTKIAHDESLL